MGEPYLYVLNTNLKLFWNSATNTEFQIRYSTLQYNSGPTIGVLKAIVHPSYNTRTNVNDIAILILSSSFLNDGNAKPMDISSSLDPRPNSLVLVSGWGRYSTSSNAVSEKLQVANLTVISRRTCAELWSPLQITSKMVCAMDRTRSACNVSLALILNKYYIMTSIQ